MMTVPPDKEQVEVWHPRYRADKQLIHFISKDCHRFAFDKEILRKESEVFRDMFSLDGGSTQKHPSTSDQEPILLDAEADYIAILFDMLSAPPGDHGSSKLLKLSIKRCIVLIGLADTYSFCRIKSVVEKYMDQHLTEHPIHVLEIASSLGLLGVDFGRKAMTHMMQEDCNDMWGGCQCGIQWKDFDGVDRAWRAELALALLQTRPDRDEPLYERYERDAPAINCIQLTAAVELFNPEQPRSETIRYITN